MSDTTGPRRATTKLSSLAQAMASSPELERVLGSVRAAGALQEIVDLCTMSWVSAGSLQARSLENGDLLLMTSSAGVAAKLRQSERRLVQLLQAKGLEVKSVKFRVQAGAQRVAQAPAATRKPDPSPQARQALEQLRALVKRR
jgi:hypothetical protein